MTSSEHTVELAAGLPDDRKYRIEKCLNVIAGLWMTALLTIVWRHSGLIVPATVGIV